MISRTQEYRNIHSWVTYYLGQPHYCNNCGNKKLRHRQYHWANISHKYKKDLKDWTRLCINCHRKYDLNRDKTICKNGHKLSEDNIVLTYPKLPKEHFGNYIICRICKLNNQRKYRARQASEDAGRPSANPA